MNDHRFIRDPHSKALISNDHRSVADYKRKAESLMFRNDEINRLKSELATLRDMVETLIEERNKK